MSSRLAAVVLAVALAACSAERRPNVLLLTVDTLRADRLGAYGYERPTSPAIDRFAETATVFEHAQAQASWTLPSLASLMTGLYSSTHGCWHFRTRLESSFTTLAESLRNSGYDTAAVANHVFLGRPYGLQQGFTHFDDELVDRSEREGIHLTVTSEDVAEKALHWLDNQAQVSDGPPWLLWAHFFDPHNEYLFHEGVSEPFAEPGGAPADLYDGEVAFTDRSVGRVLERLESLGLARDTIVVLVADHGEAFGEHQRIHHSDTLYGELVQVPLVIRVPGAAPSRVSTPVQTADVFPTLAELVGLPRPDVAGRSLAAAVRGEPLAEEPVLSEVMAPGYVPGAPPPERTTAVRTTVRSVTLGGWKLIEQDSGLLELYDLAGDPGELHDLAESEPERVASMRVALGARVAAAVERGAGYERSPEMQLSADQLAALKALGYVEGGQ